MTLKKEITEQIKDLLRQNPNGLSITAIVRQIRINRNTAGRYLENLMVSGQVEMRHFGMAKIYRLAQRVPLSAMLSISSELIMLLDNSRRVIYANEPMLAFLGTTQKDLYGRNIEFTPCVTVFDAAFDLLKKKAQGGINGREWTGELSVQNGSRVFACRIAPAVFEEGQRGVSVLLEDITERRQAEETIRNSELHFRLLAENTFDVISRHNPEGVCLYVSPAITMISGFEPREIIGHEGSEFVHPDDARRMELYYGALTPDNPSGKVTYRCRHKEGKYIWVESSFRAIFDDKTGQTTEIYGVTRDITERILAEEALRESEDRYRKLVEISPDAILLHQNGRIVYMNPAAFRMIRASHPEDIIGKSVFDIFHPDFHEVIQFYIERDLRGDRTPPLELPLMRLDGTHVLVEGRGVRTMIAGSPAVQVTLRDITERKKGEDALRKSEERYRSLAEASCDLIYVIDRNDVVEYANSHASTLLGKGLDQIIGKTRASLFPGEIGRRQAKRLYEVFATGRPVRSEGAMPVDGSMHWFDHILLPIWDSMGKVSSVLGISRDITDRKKSEETLRESEERFRDLVTATSDIIWEADRDARFVYISPAIEDILGYSPDELIGHSPFDFLDPATREVTRGVFDAAATRRESFIRYDSRWVHKDGRIVILEGRARPIIREDGSVAGLRGIDRDITDRIRFEETLRVQEEEFRMLAENSVDIISRIQPDGTCIYVSPAVRACLGYNPDEVTGRSGFEYLHPDDLPHVMEMIRNFEANGTETGTDRFRMRHKNGSFVWLEATIRAVREDDTGHVKEFTMVSRPVGTRGVP
ncbi:MAG: Bacterioopsin transcriptional activator [Methanoregula sp. PtaU1.Bin051]|nr:MAG: Bacterioopsin transcriptional activator [Methanoregula sp. PtaU1.Bin051]